MLRSMNRTLADTNMNKVVFDSYFNSVHNKIQTINTNLKTK